MFSKSGCNKWKQTEEQESCLVWHLLPGVQLVRVLCSAGSQPAREKRPKVPFESRFVSDFLAAVCPERSVGAAAAWHGVAASGVLLLACFSPLHTPLLRTPLRALCCRREMQESANHAGTGRVNLGARGLLSNLTSPPQALCEPAATRSALLRGHSVLAEAGTSRGRK